MKYRTFQIEKSPSNVQNAPTSIEEVAVPHKKINIKKPETPPIQATMSQFTENQRKPFAEIEQGTII